MHRYLTIEVLNNIHYIIATSVLNFPRDFQDIRDRWIQIQVLERVKITDQVVRRGLFHVDYSDGNFHVVAVELSPLVRPDMLYSCTSKATIRSKQNHFHR